MKKNTSLQRISTRPGEGYAVDLTIVSTDKNNVVGTMDMSSLPVPDRRFASDAANIRVDGHQVKLLFAQKQPVGDDLLSMLIVTMAPESVVQLLETLNDKFMGTLREYLSKLPAVELETFKANAPQSVALMSSVALVGFTGSTACLDFYFASPFSVQQLATIRKLSLEPVVRVTIPTGVLLALIDGLRKVGDDFKPLLPRH